MSADRVTRSSKLWTLVRFARGQGGWRVVTIEATVRERASALAAARLDVRNGREPMFFGSRVAALAQAEALNGALTVATVEKAGALIRLPVGGLCHCGDTDTAESDGEPTEAGHVCRPWGSA